VVRERTFDSSQDFTFDMMQQVMREISRTKSPSALVHFPGLMSNIRAYIYAMLSGDNGFLVSEEEIKAACSRFGLDNPCPSVTRRLAWYGNQDEIEKMVERAANKFGTDMIDPEDYTGVEMKETKFKIPNLDMSAPKENNLVEIGETKG